MVKICPIRQFLFLNQLVIEASVKPFEVSDANVAMDVPGGVRKLLI